MTHLRTILEDARSGLALVIGPGRRYFIRETLLDGRQRIIGKGHTNLGVAKAKFQSILGLRKGK